MEYEHKEALLEMLHSLKNVRDKNVFWDTLTAAGLKDEFKAWDEAENEEIKKGIKNETIDFLEDAMGREYARQVAELIFEDVVKDIEASSEGLHVYNETNLRFAIGRSLIARLENRECHGNS